MGEGTCPAGKFPTVISGISAAAEILARVRMYLESLRFLGCHGQRCILLA